MKEFTTEVLVVGGGPSGIAAALSAAREGAKVLLAEKDGLFGGMSTAGLLNVWCGSASSDIWLDIRARTTEKRQRRSVYSPETLKGLYIDMLDEAGVQMLLHAQLIGVEMKGGSIEKAVFYGKSGHFAVRAQAYIDSTGDGDLAFRAGVPFEKGRAGDGLMQPMSLEFMVGGVDDEKAVYPTFGTHPALEEKMQEYVRDGRILSPAGHVILLEGYEKGTAHVNCTNVIRADGTDETDLTRAELLTRRQIPQIVTFLRECVPGYENVYLLASASHIGVRESRRFRGAYCLTEEDILAQRVFPDWVVSNAVFSFGAHSLTGAGREASVPDYHGERYTIPYRCFLPEEVDNLLLNGRCICGTHLAHSSYRVMPICFAMGEGTGTAAAISARRGIRVRQVPAQDIQAQLMRQGVEAPAPLDVNIVYTEGLSR